MSDLDFTMDDFDNGVETISEESTETTTTEEIKAEASTEIETEAKAESDSTEGEPQEAKTEGDDSGAESPATEYKPDFSYKIKDEQFEFPEFLREVVKDKDKEDELRDIVTKAFALDGVKESRTAIESEFNGYKQGVENDIYPVLDKIADFDRANSTKDFGSAWELSDVNPNDVIDYLLMDEKLSESVYQKVLDQMKLEEQGPQALAAKRANWTEQQNSRNLELKNTDLSNRLERLESNNASQVLDFTLNQNVDAVNQYDSTNGVGSFKNFVKDLGEIKKARGENLAPNEVVSQAITMLGLGNAQATTTGNNVNINEQTKATPKVSKQPAALPNLGTGSNVSMVQKQASNFDDWEKQLQQA